VTGRAPRWMPIAVLLAAAGGIALGVQLWVALSGG